MMLDLVKSYGLKVLMVLKKTEQAFRLWVSCTEKS